MGIYIGKSLKEEILSVVRSVSSSTGDDYKRRIEDLSSQVNDLQQKIKQLENELKKSHQNERKEGKESAQKASMSHNQASTTNNVPSSSNSPARDLSKSDRIKILYSNFEGGVFPPKHRVGSGDAELSKPEANWVIEFSKDSNSGDFYPNPNNLKSLAFNPDYNLAPVSIIEHTGSLSSIAPGKVRFDPQTQIFTVTVKCKVSIL